MQVVQADGDLIRVVGIRELSHIWHQDVCKGFHLEQFYLDVEAYNDPATNDFKFTFKNSILVNNGIQVSNPHENCEIEFSEASWPYGFYVVVLWP